MSYFLPRLPHHSKSIFHPRADVFRPSQTRSEMARFNNAKASKNINLAGGQAYSMTPEMELVTILLSSFVQDQFYRSAEDTLARVTELLTRVDPEFAAKAAVYARTEFGMRSISHAVAAELTAGASGTAWGIKFYDRVVRRPDDMLEIMAAFKAIGGKNPTNAMKKGFANAIGRFDGYQLAKYRGEGKGFKLVDLVNLVRPVPTERNAEALKALVADTLRNTATWEAQMTQAGKMADTAEAKAEMKAGVWAKLLAERKLGYLALLRNLRNMAEVDHKLVPVAAEALTNEKAIRGSLVMPFQIYMAYTIMKGMGNVQLMAALDRALEISLDNVPRFDGKTLVVLDDSASMTSSMRGQFGGKSCIEMGAVFAAALVKSNDADLMRFSDTASYVNVRKGQSVIEMADRLIKSAVSGGTNFHAIFERAQKRYDRIIILSDMQGWVGYNAPTAEFEAYKKRFGANPFVHSFDLAGYGTTQLPDDKTFLVAGFSDKVFDTMKLVESDRRALVNTIKAMTWDA